MGTMKVFMRVEGFAGSSTEKGREGWSDVRGFTHEMTYPFDMRDNKGRGEPEHGAFLVSKEMDKASPKFYEALAKKKKVDQVVLEFERDTPGAGSTEIYFRITLTDCRVIMARPHIPSSKERAEDAPPHMEEVGFAYRHVKWEWLSGGALETVYDFTDPSS